MAITDCKLFLVSATQTQRGRNCVETDLIRSPLSITLAGNNCSGDSILHAVILTWGAWKCNAVNPRNRFTCWAPLPSSRDCAAASPRPDLYFNRLNPRGSPRPEKNPFGS